MDTKFLILTKNTQNRLSSVFLANKEGVPVGNLVMSHPEPTGERGWFKSVMKELTGTEFHVTQPVTADTDEVEAFHHNIISTDLKHYSKDKFFEDMQETIVPSIVEKLQVESDIHDMIGTTGSVSIENIRNHLSPLHTIPENTTFTEFCSNQGYSGIMLMVQHVDRTKKYFAEYAMAIMDIAGNVEVTFDMMHFVEMLHPGKYAYVGEVFSSNCSDQKSTVTDAFREMVMNKIAEKIEGMSKVSDEKYKAIDRVFL